MRKIASEGNEYLTIFCQQLGEDQSLNAVLVCSALEPADTEPAGASGSDSGMGGGDRFEFLNEQPPDSRAEPTMTRSTTERLRAYREVHTAKANELRPAPNAKPK